MQKNNLFNKFLSLLVFCIGLLLRPLTVFAYGGTASNSPNDLVNLNEAFRFNSLGILFFVSVIIVIGFIGLLRYSRQGNIKKLLYDIFVRTLSLFLCIIIALSNPINVFAAGYGGSGGGGGGSAVPGGATNYKWNVNGSSIMRMTIIKAKPDDILENYGKAHIKLKSYESVWEDFISSAPSHWFLYDAASDRNYILGHPEGGSGVLGGYGSGASTGNGISAGHHKYMDKSGGWHDCDLDSPKIVFKKFYDSQYCTVQAGSCYNKLKALVETSVGDYKIDWGSQVDPIFNGAYTKNYMEQVCQKKK